MSQERFEIISSGTTVHSGGLIGFFWSKVRLPHIWSNTPIGSFIKIRGVAVHQRLVIRSYWLFAVVIVVTFVDLFFRLIAEPCYIWSCAINRNKYVPPFDFFFLHDQISK